MNLTLRPFRGKPDIPAMVDIANASFAADQMDIVRTVEDVERDYFTEGRLGDCDPYRDVVMAEVDGQVMAYARAFRWPEDDGTVLHAQLGLVPPAWRGKGIGRALLQWIEQRHRDVAAERGGGPQHVHHAFVTGGEVARRRLVEGAGYVAARHFVTMTRPLAAPIELLALPAGIELRPVLPEHHRLIWDAHREAFVDHWGRSAVTEKDYQDWLANEVLFKPQLWQIAWDTASNEIAGQVRTCINHEDNRTFNRLRGWTDFISTRKPWRRRGLARALISHSLHTLRGQGMTESMLGADSENADGAVRLYESCGFRTVKRSTTYRKPMAVSA